MVPAVPADSAASHAPLVQEVQAFARTAAIPTVPFLSQFKDISSSVLGKKGCGITSLAMLIDYYDKTKVSVDTLLTQGLQAGAYESGAGWTYKGLIAVSKKYGLDGASYDLARSDAAYAFSMFQNHLRDGPLIASVHYKFDPRNAIPHLVVITAIRDGLVYYNDPAAQAGGKSISISVFRKAWKQRFIAIRPMS